MDEELDQANLIKKITKKGAKVNKVYKLYNICYETDGEILKSLNLPTEALVMVGDETDIALEGADLISDNTGFLVTHFSFKEMKKYPKDLSIGKFFTKKWIAQDVQNK